MLAALADVAPRPDGATVLMVVGAGRGPLVKASLAAAGRAGRVLRVYAVEKNPNAVVHLRALCASQGWGAAVTLVSADMRSWVAPESADILVSELLGSFGDNELSPECLDGAMRFLRPGGICIPQSYTSYLAPVTTTKLHNDAKAYKARAAAAAGGGSAAAGRLGRRAFAPGLGFEGPHLVARIWPTWRRPMS